MKKFMTLLILIVLCLATSICNAGQWKTQYDFARRNFYFVYPMFPFSSKLNVTAKLDSICYHPHFDHKLPRERIYGDRKRAAAVAGFVIDFENNSDDFIIIEWKNSSISVDGESIGVPFFNSMKYADAGNPSALANDILPPHGALSKEIIFPTVRYRYGDSEYSSRWVIDGVILLKGVERKVDYYIALAKNDGSRDILHINLPRFTVRE